MKYIKKLFVFIKDNPRFWWFLVFLAGGFMYFSSNLAPLERTAIYTAFDDKIPFIPAFIVPYILWYPYVGMLSVSLFFKDNKAFVRQMIIILTCKIVCVSIFVLYPTKIEFRPTEFENDIFSWACSVFFAADQPVNAMPSLHVAETISAFLPTFVFGPFRKNKLYYAISAILAVLICISTVFVKQHSILDVFAGAVVSLAIVGVWELIFAIRDKRKASV